MPTFRLSILMTLSELYEYITASPNRLKIIYEIMLFDILHQRGSK